ncbi:MAG: peptidoglycan-binding protein [Acidimicrobiia bacterium]
MRRRSWVTAGAAVIVAGGAVAAVVVSTSDTTGATSARARQSESLQPVEARTLATTKDVTGTIGFGTATAVTLSTGSSSSATSASTTGATGTGSAASAAGSSSTTGSSSSSAGTITALPGVGTVVPAGNSFAEVDGVPSAFLMIGTRPAWRAFTSGMDDGADVRQLETSLAWLGYANYLTVDDTFTSGTTRAIEAFQSDRGITDSGTLTTAQVVFEPGSVRVASQTAKIGGTASGEILTTTGTSALAHVDLDATLVASATVGAKVTLDLPDGSSANGTIASVGSATSSTTTASGNQQTATTTTTVGVDIVVDGQDVARYDGASVVVHLVTAKAENVLSVPVKSLVALAEGGFAVERVRSGRHQLAKVTPGTYAGGFVQVSGDVAAGDRVVTP